MNIKSIFQDFVNDNRDKVRTPYFSVFILIWLVRNWELIFTIFNFDEIEKRTDKTTLIGEYISKAVSPKELLTTTGLAFIGITVSYLLISLSKTITLAYKNFVTPFINNLFDKNLNVDKEIYNTVKQERDRFRRLYDDEQNASSGLAARLNDQKILISKIADEHEKTKQDYTELLETKSNVDLINKRLENSRNINRLFSKIWKLSYNIAGKGGDEYFEIFEGIYYKLEKGKRIGWFSLDMVEISEDDKTIKFRKKGISPNDMQATVELIKQNDTTYKGIEINTFFIETENVKEIPVLYEFYGKVPPSPKVTVRQL